MMTREQAIELLKYFGYDAKIRDWMMGATIQVPIGPKFIIGSGDDAVNCYRGVLYIYPDYEGLNGKWGITDCNLVDRIYDNLEQAVYGADQYINFITPFLKPFKS